MQHKVSPTTIKILELSPRFVLGEVNLFDCRQGTIVLTEPFLTLLKFLVEIKEIDPRVLKATSLYDLNAILQQFQGTRGGLLRKEKAEWWDLDDNPKLQQYRRHLTPLFEQLGFALPKSLNHPMSVQHCMLFGGYVERMEKRISETLRYLQTHLKIDGHIFLLGSERKLMSAELEYLQKRFPQEFRSNNWEKRLNDPMHDRESSAFMFLWESLAPQVLQAELKEKLIAITSTRIGSSYQDRCGYRTTTEVTIEDWIDYHKPDQPQNIFGLIEQPYVRLTDQLRMTLLSKIKAASTKELIDRIKNTTFFFALSASDPSDILSLVLDEIGRNVYRIVDTIKYLDHL